ncbi:LuxR C-terminal-related transcriptional regulator, partial [Nocardioides hankookensis]
VAAGWAIVHGQQVATYRALSWMSRRGPGAESLPAGMARALGQGMDARSAVVWMGSADDLRAVGVWPEVDADIAPTTAGDLAARPGTEARVVVRDVATIGAVSIERDPRSSSLSPPGLLDDLAAQAAIVIEQTGLVEVLAGYRRDGRVDNLTPREHEVLELMARGLSNAAICAELHLSVKTVEPAVSAIFAKLGLQADGGSNRRVLAVLAYLRSRSDVTDPAV